MLTKVFQSRGASLVVLDQAMLVSEKFGTKKLKCDYF